MLRFRANEELWEKRVSLTFTLGNSPLCAHGRLRFLVTSASPSWLMGVTEKKMEPQSLVVNDICIQILYVVI